MPPTLRQHVAGADEIMSTLGVKSLIPQLGLPAPQRVDFSDGQRDYALSVLIPLVAFDRTGWVAIYERASREAASSIWERIPDHLVCPECLSRAMAVKVNVKPQVCRKCGERRRPVTFRGIVAWDIRRIKQRLREGDIQVA
jgi:ribosomal protein L37AE/L43A